MSWHVYVLVIQDEADVGPVREIDFSTFDERSSRQRQRLPEPTSACSANAHSQMQLTNGTTTEGRHVPSHLVGGIHSRKYRKSQLKLVSLVQRLIAES